LQATIHHSLVEVEELRHTTTALHHWLETLFRKMKAASNRPRKANSWSCSFQ